MGARSEPTSWIVTAAMTDPFIETIRLSPGHELADGKYVVTALLGAGAMGTVYRAEHRALHRDVAIKVMHPEVFERQPKAAKRFEREARAAAALDHPNSVRVLDFGIEGRMHYLVMEYVEGKSLDQVVSQEGTFNDGRIARLMYQVCSALAKAHDAGTIHRDLKPQNILLIPETDDEGLPSEGVKVCDFGIAKVSWAEPGESDDALTEAGSVMGTPQYMSPEQCQAEELDARADLYSLGCVMYFLATGKHPFEGPTALTTMLMHIQEPVRPPRELNPAIDPAMEAMILMAMAKDKLHRPADARDFRRRVGALVGLQSAELDIPTTVRAGSEAEAGYAATLMTPEAGISALSGSLATSGAPDGQLDSTQARAGEAPGHPLRWAVGAGLLIGLSGLAAYALLGTPAEAPVAQAPATAVSVPAPGKAAPAAVPPTTAPTKRADKEAPVVAKAAAAKATQPTTDEAAPAPAPTGDVAPSAPAAKRSEARAKRAKPTKAKPPKKKLAKREPPKARAKTKTPPAAAPAQPKAAAVVDKPPVVAKAEASKAETSKVEAVSPKVVKPAAPKSFEAAVRIGSVTVSGSLPKSAIAKAARRLSPKFAQCYLNAARKAVRAPAVTLRVRGTIDEDGRPRALKAKGGGLPGLAACVRSAAARLRSARPDTGTVDMNFEVRFVPKG